MSEMGPIPRGPLAAAGAMVAGVLVLTAAPTLGLLDRPVTPQAKRETAGVAMVLSRELRFLDRADGAVVVEDIADPAGTRVIAPGSNQGFIRGVLRGLARDRRMRGIDDRPPFRLALWANGRLSLTDRATGRTIELDSFGADNRKAFAQLLETPTRVASR